MYRYFFTLVCVVGVLSLVSCKTATMKAALEYEAQGEYYQAAETFRKVYSKTSPKKTALRGQIAYHQAEMYRKLNNTSRALIGYNNAIRYKYADTVAILRQAQMFHQQGKYVEAIKRYNDYLKLSSDSNRMGRNGIAGCELAQEWKKAPAHYAVKKMDKWAGRDGEFSPMFLGTDQLYITASRTVKGATEVVKNPITGIINTNFFAIRKDERGNWLLPDSIDGGLNTTFDEGTASFTSDGSRMYYTFCPEGDGGGAAEVRVSSRSGGQWGAGSRVPLFKDSAVTTAHPAVGVDGYLYFVSDNPYGSYGGKDIWRVELNKIGEYYPDNLGPEINTVGDEFFPYMREDSTLFFSSNGHPGMGGLDIFRANFAKEHWHVNNMKSPINSMADDFGITFYPKKESGFFSSNRNDARNADHIYSFELPEAFAYLEGWVVDNEEMVIPDASVRLVGKDGSNMRVLAAEDGTYVLDIKSGTEYVLMASAPDFLNQKDTLTVPKIDQTSTFFVDFYLQPMTKPVVVDNIFYDFNKTTLRTDSKEALGALIAMLTDNPHVTIEMSAHTDRIGSDDYNTDLSQRRAQSVVDYLIQNGIEKERLEAKGYGKTAPLAVTKKLSEKYDFLPEGQLLDEAFIQTLPPIQQATADQINRRTEFKVLTTNYKLR
ncbi:hypothetical protein SAMD00024442_31_3 [Candidatus Symbiothrix dinenymphae]|nr:hypothetical protein SAMD00024442_31_3 [Candidatus Symbiothrix dinenymphae]